MIIKKSFQKNSKVLCKNQIENDLKVLIVSQSIFKYQNYNRAIQIAKYLKLMNVHVTIITVNPKFSIFPKTVIHEGIRVILSPEILPRKFKISNFGPLDTIFRSLYCIFNKFDVYHIDGHRPTALFSLIFSKLFHSESVFISEWMDWYDIKPRKFYDIKKCYDALTQVNIRKYFHCTITISKFLNRFLTLRGIKNSYYLPTYCDFIPQISKRSVSLSNNEIKKINICIIKIDSADQKDFSFSIKSLEYLDKKTNANIHLYITGNENPLVDTLTKFNNIRVEFVGYLEDYWGFLSTMDIALLPFLHSRKNFTKYPHKFNDFLSIGLPVVFHPTGELKYLNDEFKIETADLIYSVKSYGDIILKLIDDEDFRKRQSKKLLEIASKLSWKNKIQELIRIYKI